MEEVTFAEAFPSVVLALAFPLFLARVLTGALLVGLPPGALALRVSFVESVFLRSCMDS